MTQTTSDISNADLEVAKILLDEWKFRQQHCWNLLPRYGLAAVIVSIVPYLKIELFKQYNIDMLVFPWVGWLLALMATWLFIAEQYRCYPVLQRYRQLIKHEKINPTDKWHEKTLNSMKVRRTTPALFIISFTVLSVLNWCILRSLM